MIFCVVQVLNGLLSRDNQKEAISVPIGIIPAGSDNSLVWTVLGVRDPISAAIAIVKVNFCIPLINVCLDFLVNYDTNDCFLYFFIAIFFIVEY